MENVNYSTDSQSNSPEISNEVGTSFQSLDSRMAELGETLGDYKAYDPQLEIAEIAGTRIVKCLYQINKQTGKKVAENSYVRVPVAQLNESVITENLEKLLPYFVNYLQEHENAIIKDDHKAGIAAVYIPALGIDKVIARLEKLELGGRINKEMITAWFDKELKSNLTVLFLEKMGVTSFDEATEEQVEKIELILRAYKGKFESLAGGKTSIKPDDCEAMISILVKCEADTSSLGTRFITRLDKMKVAVEDMLETL